RRKKVLFVVAGIGLGNSTRCQAVMEHLLNKGVECEIATYGKGYQYFTQNLTNVRVLRMHDIALHGFGFWDFLKASLRFLFRTFLNDLFILRQIRQSAPDAIVYDSVYGFFPRLFSRAKILSINHSDVILREALRETPPCSTWISLVVELLDFL